MRIIRLPANARGLRTDRSSAAALNNGSVGLTDTESPWMSHVRTACELLAVTGKGLIPAVSVTYTLQGDEIADREQVIESSRELAEGYGLFAAVTQFRPPVFTIRISLR